jgi:aerobic carbon-monoxide dehydrogenase medium subunit
MKAPEFDYVRARSLEEVFALLDEYGDEARILAGGQTLLATMNMRLSEPQILVDIAGLSALKQVSVVGDVLRIGAMVTHAEIEDSPVVREHAPLLSEVAPFVAHRAIRNLGTFGGSIAFADPAAEWPCILVAVRGVVIAQGVEGQRRIPADEFFIDLYTTALRPGEIIVALDIPLKGPKSIYAFDELTRRHGDYAIVGAVITGNASEKGLLKDARIVFLGTGNKPDRAHAVEQQLETTSLTRTTAASFARALDISPGGDLYTSAETKLHLARVTLERLLSKLALTLEVSEHD